jgi:hypothetical protein
LTLTPPLNRGEEAGYMIIIQDKWENLYKKPGYEP